MPIPQPTIDAVLRRANGACEDCGSYPFGMRQTLELHHLHYRTVNSEAPDDLLALCRRCHQRLHTLPSGAIEPDPEEVAAEWEAYRHVQQRRTK